MAMVKKYVCDRCGKEHAYNKSDRGWNGFQFFGQNPRGYQNPETGRNEPYKYGGRMYLCPECQEALESWAFEEKDDEGYAE